MSAVNEAGLSISSVKLLVSSVKVPGERMCAPGQFLRGSTCILCDSGYYCLGGDFFRARCTNAVSQAGSSSRSACVCSEGFGGSNGMCMDCTRLACLPGNFTTGCGGTSPGTCSSCGPCGAGLFREGCTRNQEGSCKACPPKTYALSSAYRTSCSQVESRDCILALVLLWCMQFARMCILPHAA